MSTKAIEDYSIAVGYIWTTLKHPKAERVTCQSLMNKKSVSLGFKIEDAAISYTKGSNLLN